MTVSPSETQWSSNKMPKQFARFAQPLRNPCAGSPIYREREIDWRFGRLARLIFKWERPARSPAKAGPRELRAYGYTCV